MSITASQAGKVIEAFPMVDPGLVPFGERVLVQLRTPKATSSGGIVLPKDTRETEKWNIQVGKIVAMGPTAFKNRDTMQTWPEGEWVKAGEFVRVPKYGGDRWAVTIPGRRARDEEDFALFVIFKDLELIGLITGNPLDVIAFI
jgi:co-chaperonin GroES (HSP10)